MLSVIFARCDRMSIRDVLSIPDTHRHVFGESFCSSILSLRNLFSAVFNSLCLSDSLSPYASILAMPRQGSLNNCSDSFSPSLRLWLDSVSMRCQRWTTRTTSSVAVSLNVSRQHAGSSRLNFWNSINCNPRQRGALIALCLKGLSSISPQEPPSSTGCHTDLPFFCCIPCTTQWLSHPAFVSCNSTLGGAQKMIPSGRDDQQRCLESYGLQTN